MKKTLVTILSALVMSVGVTRLRAQGQGATHASVLVPDSTVEHPEDVGVRAHTNHLILVPAGARPDFGSSSPQGETPQSIRPVYNLPLTITTASGNGIIAIVDAFDYPTAQNDFDVFSKQFGLPLSTDTVCNGANPCFKKVFATGTQPRGNCSWGQEAALDIEWSHAMAPYARIVLVEAASNSFSDLFQAVDVATGIVTGSNKTGQVSMSWGGSEFSSESSNDSHFTATGVVYFASSGDTGGVNIYPSVSPNVVSAGGTSVNRDKNGNFVSETAWSGSGGGPSKYESIPSYQSVIASIVGSQRGAPDFSFDADPNTGVSVYDSTRCQGASGWLVFGGTSVASPSLSGIVNLSGSKYSSSATELGTIYGCISSSGSTLIYSGCYPTNFRDITSGTAGSFSATTGWDFVTGVGSNQGTGGK